MEKPWIFSLSVVLVFEENVCTVTFVNETLFTQQNWPWWVLDNWFALWILLYSEVVCVSGWKQKNYRFFSYYQLAQKWHFIICRCVAFVSTSVKICDLQAWRRLWRRNGEILSGRDGLSYSCFAFYGICAPVKFKFSPVFKLNIYLHLFIITRHRLCFDVAIFAFLT